MSLNYAENISFITIFHFFINALGLVKKSAFYIFKLKTIRYDTIEEFNVDFKAEYTA